MTTQSMNFSSFSSSCKEFRQVNLSTKKGKCKDPTSKRPIKKFALKIEYQKQHYIYLLAKITAKSIIVPWDKKQYNSKAKLKTTTKRKSKRDKFITIK